MNNLAVINTAICLPAPDIEALIQGRTIVAMSKNYIVPERQFALYPMDSSINVLPVEQYYHTNFLANAKTALIQVSVETISIKAWVKCEKCEPLHNTESLSALSPLTIWTTEALKEILGQRHNIFLLYLRVYQLPKLITLSLKANSQFIYLNEPLTISEAKPVLNDRTFAQRKHQLENRQPPLYPELEKLQNAIASLTISQPAAKQLDDDIKIFLGWSSNQPTNTLDLDLAWIQKIAKIGNSSDGHTFEKLVRRGLLKLGFTGSGLNPDATGGAGGMDFYTEQPYPIVGECKATKTEKVTDGTPAQLLKIGMNHLGKFQYDNSIKLIIAAGELNFYALRTATENQMNVISPETLQKLIALQANYKNSINLLELKECLQQAPFGLAEDKLNTYIDKVEQSIRLRSHIIHLVKNYLENSGIESAGVEALHGAYFGSHPPQRIQTPEMHEILIELSSPLTGYLGRIKGSDWKSDRFYFLRNLTIN
ncbi:DUF1802 family protein [Nostoc sp. 'Lobaria pulmonaria (5183) cyanobiont']|uniref:DUF1802 family protein n=1 Tax=Nostoc sp. 'Lobaria pulmonaria (5183) cyanobiont' TaxID=1618022 RepID=UPI000D0C1AF7|nr:DUF1802 family protein [Nostoc sp. 'Lobaria pulmonaria (5183) cyanobiont']AVH71930.1 protein of unknown function DUF1802 [Nostoc sp. 'Lobaria pulmonaria (5183) cyanobiont']